MSGWEATRRIKAPRGTGSVHYCSRRMRQRVTGKERLRRAATLRYQTGGPARLLEKIEACELRASKDLAV